MRKQAIGITKAEQSVAFEPDSNCIEARSEVLSCAQKKEFGAAAIDPTMHTPPAEQNRMAKMWLDGKSISAISRELHRNRRTVARVVRSDEVEAVVEKLKGTILSSWQKWAESLDYAVENETDGAMAYKLSKKFGAIPIEDQW